MDVSLDGSTEGFAGKIEILEERSGRRFRSEGERARIAAESLVPGVHVADVARRHEVTRWQVYDWRKKLKAGVLALPAETAKEPMFAALVVEPKTVRSPRRPKKRRVTAKPGTRSTRPTPATSWPTSALPKTTSSARSMLPPTPIKPPWAYHWGLEKAKAHLQVLGAPEPDMPPFDESKHENLPEVEINPKDEHWVDPSVPLAALLDLD